MLNFQFAQNIIANFAPQVKTQVTTDVVSALADSFVPAEGKDAKQPSDFGTTLADASAKSQEARRKSAERASEDDAKIAANRDDTNAHQTAKLEKRDEVNHARPEKVAKPKQDVSENNTKPKADEAQKSDAVSANDNVERTDGKIDAKKIVADVEDVIDQIDLALASGGEQLSAEMAAMLAAMKDLLAQVLQQFNGALASGEASGEETVKLDSAAFAPLLKRLDQLVNSLKEANADLAVKLGLVQEASDGDVEKNVDGADKKSGIFEAISARATDIAVKLQRAIEAAPNPFKQAEVKGLSQQAETATLVQPVTTTVNFKEAVQEIAHADKAEPKAIAPLPVVNQPQGQAAQNAQAAQAAAALQMQSATSAGGQSAGQFGQSGQGQTQSGIAQPSSLQAATSQQVLAKDAPNFEQVLKAPIRGSASEQVSFQMKAMVKDGTSKMIVKLDPPELGELEITMRVSAKGKAEVSISVERSQTLELLQKDSRMLQQALNDAGLKAESGSLSFNLRGENSSGGQRQGNNPYPVKADVVDEELLQVASATYTTEVQHGVNIHI